MIKGTPELIAQRREEIINACEQLYRKMSFREITLKEISSITSFSRPTIYNYFETKEEIFLALFQREYERWNEDLTAILENNEELAGAELAEMEANSRKELLTQFKVAYGRSMQLVRKLLEKFCPDMEETDIRSFLYTFYPFMFGIYPYAEVTEKQKTAMEEAGVDCVSMTVYELTLRCLMQLLGERQDGLKQ